MINYPSPFEIGRAVKIYSLTPTLIDKKTMPEMPLILMKGGPENSNPFNKIVEFFTR